MNTKNEFDRMFSQKNSWEAVLGIAIGCCLLGVFVSLIAAIVSLIPWPENMDLSSVYGLNFLTGAVICVVPMIIVGERGLGLIFGLSESIFLLFKSRRWKRRYSELNV